MGTKSVFAGDCDAAPDRRHKPVRLYGDAPHIGCLHCRLRNRLVKPTPQQAYDMLVSMSVSATEATRRTGYASNYRSGPHRAQKGSEVARTAYEPQGEKEHSDV